MQKWCCAQEQPIAPFLESPAFDVLEQSAANFQSPGRRQNCHAANMSRLSLEDRSHGPQDFGIAERKPHRSFSHATHDLPCVWSCRRKALASVERLKLHKGFVEHRRHNRRIVRSRAPDLNFRWRFFSLQRRGIFLCPAIHILTTVAPTVSTQWSNSRNASSHCIRWRSLRSRILFSSAGSRSNVIFAG